MENKKIYGIVEEEETIELTFDEIDENSVETNENNSHSSENKTEKESYGSVSEYENTEGFKKKEPVKETYGSAPEYKNTEGFKKKEPVKEIYDSVPVYENLKDFKKKNSVNEINDRKQINYKNVLVYMLTGIMGSIIAFVLAECSVANKLDDSNIGQSLRYLIYGLNYGIIGSMISGLLGCVEDLKSFSVVKFVSHFFLSAALGFLSGFCCGIIYQYIIIFLQEIDILVLYFFDRIVGCIILGIFIGMSQSIIDFSYNPKRFKNGLLGGLIGGAISGFLYNLLIMFMQLDNEMFNRFLSLIIIGALIGWFIGLLSEKSK